MNISKNLCFCRQYMPQAAPLCRSPSGPSDPLFSVCFLWVLSPHIFLRAWHPNLIRLSSSLKMTCSTTIAVSNPLGMATPVFANSHCTPRVHPDVSGMPFLKSSQCTATESIRHVRQFGLSHCAYTSSASILPAAEETGIVSVRGSKLQFWRIVATASSLSTCICFV